MVDEAAEADFFSASILALVRSGRRSQALNGTVTIFLEVPLRPLSTRATFFGLSMPSPSSLLRFLGGLGRLSTALAAPFGCWPCAAANGGGDAASGVETRAIGATAMEYIMG